MNDLNREYIYLDGMWLKEGQLLKLAENAGSLAVAEHYLCAYLANAVMNGRREALLEVNEVREHYGAKPIPLGGDDLKDDEELNGRHRTTAAEEKARAVFQGLTHEERVDVLRRSMRRLVSEYHLFVYARHWLAIFMVVKDRLVGESLNQTRFLSLADDIAPDDLPEKLRMCKNTMKNFSREIVASDRGEVYYKMKHNPQQQLCDTFWSIIQETILTEI